MFNQLVEELARYDEVEAIALGGSRAGEFFDEQSDYDVYVYLTEPLAVDKRQAVLDKYCSYMEYGNQFWELEDDGVLKNGIEIEFIYRNLDDFRGEVEAVVLEHQAHNSYTTAMWHNLLHSKIIFDRKGRYAELQKDLALPFPKELKDNIVTRQLQLLETKMPAYPRQIKKALERGDWVALNHRVAEFLASYFDLIFAFNEQTHPGEKRMLTYAKKTCPHLPKDFESNLTALFDHLFDEQNTAIVEDLVAGARELVTSNN